MDKIYERAFCNISATSGRDSSEGLYLDRTPQLPIHLIVRVGDVDREIIEVSMFKELEYAPLQQVRYLFVF
jgi:hypothetical protein